MSRSRINVTEEQLREAYWEDNLTVSEVASKFGVSAPAIHRAMDRFDIPRRSLSEARLVSAKRPLSRVPELCDRAWLEAEYLEKQRSMLQIARSLGCSQTTVLQAIRKHEITTRLAKGNTEKTKQAVIPALRDVEWLKLQYLDNGRTPADIAEEIGCTYYTLASYLSRWGIRRKEARPTGPYDPATSRTRRNDGYIMVWNPEHPNAPGSGYIYQHRMVAEAALGRLLTKTEVVHHLNEVRDDNREENLLVFPDNATHMAFHGNPPDWVPRCHCCNQTEPLKLLSRPADVPLLYLATPTPSL